MYVCCVVVVEVVVVWVLFCFFVVNGFLLLLLLVVVVVVVRNYACTHVDSNCFCQSWSIIRRPKGSVKSEKNTGK